MREIEQNCFRDGGYCINVIPPPAPRQRNRQRGRGGAAGKMGTRTRKGSRPDPRALGAQHTRLPASSQKAAPAGGAGAAFPPPPGRPAPAYNPAAPTGGPQTAAPQNLGLFGNTPNDPFNSLFGMMMFTRKKRQIPEPHERPRIRRGQSMFSFLNQHCRKTEFDYGCRREGGMCCLPVIQ